MSSPAAVIPPSAYDTGRAESDAIFDRCCGPVQTYRCGFDSCFGRKVEPKPNAAPAAPSDPSVPKAAAVNGGGGCLRRVVGDWLGFPVTPSLLEWIVFVLVVAINAVVGIVLIHDFASAAAESLQPVSATARHKSVYGNVYDAQVSASGSMGTLGSVNIAIALIPATRFSVMTLLTGISVERSVCIHRWLMRAGVAWYAVHMFTLWHAYVAAGTILTVDGFDGGITSETGSGYISFMSAALLLVTSLEWVRRSQFEIFYRFHWIFAILFYAFAFIHEGTNILLMVVPLICWVVDLAHRVYTISRGRTIVRKLELLPADIIRLEFERTGDQQFTYHAGQYVFICIPAISAFEWHPFSFSSSPHNRTLVVHIRALGDWTRALKDFIVARAGAAPATAEADRVSLPAVAFPTLWVEGPYGRLTFPLHKYSHMLLMSGGIGITPLQSIFNSVLHKYRDHKAARAAKRVTAPDAALYAGVKHVKFVWSVRDIETVRALAPAREIMSAATPRASVSVAVDVGVELSSKARNGSRGVDPRVHPTPADPAPLTPSTPPSRKRALPLSFQPPNLLLDAVVAANTAQRDSNQLDGHVIVSVTAAGSNSSSQDTKVETPTLSARVTAYTAATTAAAAVASLAASVATETAHAQSSSPSAAAGAVPVFDIAFHMTRSTEARAADLKVNAADEFGLGKYLKVGRMNVAEYLESMSRVAIANAAAAATPAAGSSVATAADTAPTVRTVPVAVLACGPASLVADLARGCVEFNGRPPVVVTPSRRAAGIAGASLHIRVRFDLHIETFEF